MSNVVPFTPRTNPATAPERPGTPAPVGRAVYTVKEVAHMLSLSLGGTYALIRTGEIPAIKLGGRWVIPRGRFHAWLDSCEVEPETTADVDPAEIARINAEVRQTITNHRQRHGA